MPQVVLARIDDRLIHGQVVIKWLRAFPCDEILVCDDGVAADAFLQRVLRLAAPPQVRLAVKSVAEGAAYLQADSPTPRVLLLMKAPQTALSLLERGVRFDRLNVGGMAAGPGTRRLYKSVSATPEQLAQLKQIRQRGVRIFFQTVPEPEESPLDFDVLSPKL